MRLFGILLASASAATMTMAQTNFSPIPGYQPAPALTDQGTGGTNSAVVVHRISLEECIDLTLTNNLGLKIDRITPQIASYAVNFAYGYYDPTFSLSGQHAHTEAGNLVVNGSQQIGASVNDNDNFSSSLGGYLPWGTTYSLQGNSMWTYGSGGLDNTSAKVSGTLTQPLLKNFWIDSPRKNIMVAKNQLQQSEQALKLQIMQTITSLEQAYYLLIYDRENVLVQQKAVQLAEQLVVEDKRRLEVGALAPLDLQSAESQAAQSRAAVLQAQSQLGTQERVVKLLITDRFLDWADVILEPTGTLAAPRPILDRQQSWRKGLTQRPDLLQAKLDLARLGIVLKYDKNQLLPEVDAFGTFGYNGSGTQFSDALYDIQKIDRPFYSYGGSLTLPLSRAKERSTYRQDVVTEKQSVFKLKQLEETILVNIDNDIGNIRAAYDQVQATKAAREYAEAALAAEVKKLENGKSTTYTVLQMQRDLTTSRGTEIQALNTYNNDLSQLSLDEGSTLDRLNINFDVR